MCEQTEVQYLDGDVVWVKLGPCWWPGEVCDISKIPPEIVKGFKKQPLAVVKFFQEDTYEYVKNLNQIYKYNCRKKNEFIKKGLDMHRAKNSFMDKFPTDVCYAETLTGGDPDIITSDAFAPEQKSSYSSIFGTPSPKKSPKVTGKGRLTTGGTPKPSAMFHQSQSQSQQRITHPRFTGHSDYETRMLEQAVSSPSVPASHYTCHICGFTSARLNVIVLHNKSHSNGTYVSPSNTTAKHKKKAKSFATTNSIDEDLELIRQGMVIVSDDDTSDSDLEKHQSPKNTTGKRKKSKGPGTGPGTSNKKSKVANICNNLLADWGDSDSNDESLDKTTADPVDLPKDSKDVQEDTEKKQTSTKSTETSTANTTVHKELLADWDDKNSDDEDPASKATNESKQTTNSEKPQETDANVTEKASCFDFSDDEEDNIILAQSIGRKIPRVIPQKRTSQTVEEVTEKTHRPTESEEVDEPEKSANDNKAGEDDTTQKSAEEPDLAAFKSILDETLVPQLPTIPDKLEVEKNFCKSESKKIPDKLDDCEKTNGVLKSSELELPATSETKETESENITEPIVTPTPKKRIVRNFEEFENLLNEQKQAEEESSKSTLEVSKLKSQLMSKLNDSPVKQDISQIVDTEARSIKTSESILQLDDEMAIREESVESQTENDNIEEKIASTENKSDYIKIDDKTKNAEEKLDITTKKLDSIEEKYVTTFEKSDSIEEKSVAIKDTPVTVDDESINIEDRSNSTEEISDTVENKSVGAEEKIDTAEHQAEYIKENTETIVTEEIFQNNAPEKGIDVIEDQETVVKANPMLMETSNEEIEETVVEQVPEEAIKDVTEIEEVMNSTTEFMESTDVSALNPDIPKQHEVTNEDTEKEKPETTSVVEESQSSQEFIDENRSQKMLVDISDICIDNSDHMSGLSTLAAVSELTGNFVYDKTDIVTHESPLTETRDENTHETTSVKEESTVVEIAGEKTTEESNVDLGTPCLQVTEEGPDETEFNEIVKRSTVSKPVATLANFSMDFSDSNSESTIIKDDVSEEVITEAASETNDNQLCTGMDDTSTEVVETGKHEDTPLVTIGASGSTAFESIENEIEKMTSIETTADKLNSFPENISQANTDCGTLDTSGTNYSVFSIPETNTTIANNEFVGKIDEVTVGNECTLESEIAKLTDTHPGAEGVLQEQQQNTSSSKLLEILTDSKNTHTSVPVSKKDDTVQADTSTQVARTVITSGTHQKMHMVISGSDSKTLHKKFDPKTSKFVIKSATSKAPVSGKSNKPIILSEKIIKPVTETENVSVKKVTSKRTFQDVEDIDTFIIQKPNKKPNTGDIDQQDIILTPKSESVKHFKGSSRARGKPKIIEQTIIKAADVVHHQQVQATESQPLLDDSMFDINSMPIVLSDQILTPESIENMPVVMSEMMPSSASVMSEKPQQQSVAIKRGGAIQQVKLLNKSKLNTSHSDTPTKLNQNVVVKNIMPRGLAKNQKVYQTGSTKILKNNPAVITQPGKPGKFIILPSNSPSSSGGSKYTVGKRLSTVKNVAASSSPSPTTSKLKANTNANIVASASEATGNKIMIVTNQQGVQSRVLLTPAQQKLLGCKMPASKANKSPLLQMKGNTVQKSILTSKGTLLSPVNSQKSTLASQTIMTSKGQMYTTSPGQTLVTSEGQVLTPITQQQLKTLKGESQKSGKKVQVQSSRVILPDKLGESTHRGKLNLMGSKTKTILIKGSQGQTLKKIQTSIGDSKNVLMSQTGHKTQLMSIGGQQMQGKQVLITPKGQIVKADGKLHKQIGEKAQKIQSPKAAITTTSRASSKATSRTQMLLSPVSNTSISKHNQIVGAVSVPPLAPITASQPKKSDSPLSQVSALKQTENKLSTVSTENKDKIAEPVLAPVDKTAEQKQPNQLIIQDAMGNQTTVTEGQILALPSGETVEGQAQSYMLVTVDETGNLVPISNDTLMSLDPSLALGGDMSNIVLQFDQGAPESQLPENKPEVPAELPVTSADPNEQQITLAAESQQLATASSATEQQQHLVAPEEQQGLIDSKAQQANYVTNPDDTQPMTTDPSPLIQDTQTVACSINSGDSSQQLIITGDPESTQKFLASLTEGNTDLSSLLSAGDGNIIINTDGQQILLNTDSENQILLSVNSDNLGLIQPGTEVEASQSAMFVSQQAMKNQDILAAALADTDVFQQDPAADKLTTSQSLVKTQSSAQAQLSPNSSLYPMNVGNVLETSLTLSSPIMTPLEVPSGSMSAKKLNTDIESTLTQVPSSLELPITITDPNISQTVSQQVMLSNDLQSNLELPITMSDTAITSIRSAEMNSPSFVYSLPTLDENSELDSKTVFTENTTSTVITTDSIYNAALTGSMSMPLLTEEPEIQVERQENNSSSHEETLVTTATETVIAETTVTESGDKNMNYGTIDPETLEMRDKLSNDLRNIGPMVEELGLNPPDICSSLSEPPPGMFDKSNFSLAVNPRYLSNKGEERNIPLAVSASDASLLSGQSNSLPDADTDAENNAASNSTTDNTLDQPNLDMDYGVSESSDQHSISDAVMSQEVQRSDLSETPNSDLNSPRLDIDENSVEIPLQPTIVTNLSDTLNDNKTPTDFETHEESKKRESEADDESSDSKRTKLSCD